MILRVKLLPKSEVNIKTISFKFNEITLILIMHGTLIKLNIDWKIIDKMEMCFIVLRFKYAKYQFYLCMEVSGKNRFS